ncbi:MAG: hybrid sensor histidine kinase/response regulator [Microcoleaceae cyanobacterium]
MNSHHQTEQIPIILIVDDVRQVRMMLRYVMEQEGYQVLEASSGRAGLAIYQEKYPDIVLLDAVMPEMDGFELCRALHQIDPSNPPAILMITALEDGQAVDKAFEAGAVDYIHKPIHISILRQRVKRLLQEKKASNQLLKNLAVAQEISELRAKFVTVVSHEFRTPMSTILLSSELLEKYNDKWSDEKKQIHFQKIKDAIEKMTRLLEDIFLIGKVEAGEIQLNPVVTDMNKLCQQVIHEWQVKVRGNYQIDFQVPATNLFAELDPLMVRQIIMNLLNNATQYSTPNSIIDLHLSAGDQLINICVKDQGCGIDPGDINHIFEPFYRGVNIGHISGTGLGLTIVKKFIDYHQGDVTVISQLGAGTTVNITLPMVRNN